MGQGLKVLVVLLVVCVGIGGKWVGAQVHHVVGGELGWHPEADLTSWSSGRPFIVGDKLWFSYSPAQESVVELQSLEEYLSCDLTNPIRMYTDGMSKVPLEEEKVRYFVSGTLKSCKNGLKIQVLPKYVAATGPTPSASTNISGLTLSFLIGLFIYVLGQ